ncbi:unnamed protein product, partial [Symbiodinium microadriaticum]
ERWTKGDEEEQVVREELDEDGYAEARAAREDATDLDLALMQGEEKQSKKKKDPVFVDMNRQQQRKGTVVKSAKVSDEVYSDDEEVIMDLHPDKRSKYV